MLADIRADDFAGAKLAWKTARRVAIFATAMLAVIALAAFEWVFAPQIDAASSIDAETARQTLAVLSGYALLCAWQAVYEIPMRSAGRYPEHVAIVAGSAALDVVAIAIALAFEGGFVALAAAMLVGRVFALLGTSMLARSMAPRLFTEDETDGTGNTAASLFRPALAFIALALIPALNLQVYALIIGAAFGPIVLAGFVATRTLARTFDIFVGGIFTLQYFEHGYLDDDSTMTQRRLLATMTALVLAAAAVFAALLLALGGIVQRVWTAGNTEFAPLIAAIVVIGAAMRGLAASPAAALAARNDHMPHTLAYVGGSIIAAIVAALLAFGGAALSAVIAMIVLAETSQALVAMGRALKALDYSPRQFLRDLVSRERLNDIGDLLAHIRQSKTPA